MRRLGTIRDTGALVVEFSPREQDEVEYLFNQDTGALPTDDEVAWFGSQLVAGRFRGRAQ